MGALKKHMHDVHDDALDLGVAEAAKKHNMSQEDVKSTVMIWAGFDGSWEDFIQMHYDLEEEWKMMQEDIKNQPKGIFEVRGTFNDNSD